MSEGAARLLIVDDEGAQMKALCDTLEAEGYATTGFVSARRALKHLREQRFDVVLTDLQMPEMDGIAFLREAREIDAALAGIVMTGHGAIDTAVEAMKTGAVDYILKPFRLNTVLPVLGRALELRRLREHNEELRRKVEQRSLELERANKDLEAFAYSVSHDLRAPLRVVEGFCQMFMEDYGNTVPADGRRLLNNASAGARRMSKLIDDLLTFARFGRQRLVKYPVALGDLVARVIAGFQPSQENSSAPQVTIGDLPPCQCDAALMEQVLINLIGNAFKFTRGRPNAAIEVGALQKDAETVYFVRDNGAGFDMKYAGKLFGVFQRLHSHEEFEGTGIGLSIVQRIVERHGGRIWAEGRPNEGATFYFTLPSCEGLSA